MKLGELTLRRRWLTSVIGLLVMLVSIITSTAMTGQASGLTGASYEFRNNASSIQISGGIAMTSSLTRAPFDDGITTTYSGVGFIKMPSTPDGPTVCTTNTTISTAVPPVGGPIVALPDQPGTLLVRPAESVGIGHPPCTQAFIDSLGIHNSTITIKGENFRDDPSPPPELPADKAITVTVYSKETFNDLGEWVNVSITNVDSSSIDEDVPINARGSAHVGTAEFLDRQPGKYTICVKPASVFDFSGCQTVTKQAGKILQVNFGSPTDVPNPQGENIKVRVRIFAPPNNTSEEVIYGPLPISIMSTDLSTSVASGDTNEGTVNAYIDIPSEVVLTVDFEEISQTGRMEACITNTNHCVDFQKRTNRLAEVEIVVSEEDSVDLINPGDVEAQSECRIKGVGWIICPVVRFMAEIVDGFYGYVETMLKFSPRFFFDSSQSDGYGAIRQPWQVMQGIANILFGIAFLFIIYSQITSAGISNYGIKRMLPKLIIGAFLINASYLITAISVDISNVLGESIYNMLNGTQLYASSEGASLIGWDTIAVGVLGAGALGTGLISFAVFLPIITAALLAMMTVTIVLTMRIALLVGLVILAPLAFAAYLLPNTEQWFKRWWATFRTLLLLYPVIALIFGGSVVANNVLMQVAGGLEGIPQLTMQIMAAGASVLPLFITPILMKTTSGVLGQVTGMVNNKERGLYDRSKNFAKRRQDRRNQMTLAGRGRFGARGNNNPIGRAGRAWNNVRRNRQAELDELDATQEANWRGSASGSRANTKLDSAKEKLEKIKVEAEIENLEYNRVLRVDTAVANLNLDAAKSGLQSDIDTQVATEGTAAYAATQAKKRSDFMSGTAQAAAQSDFDRRVADGSDTELSDSARDKWLFEQSSASSAGLTRDNSAQALEDSDYLKQIAAGADTEHGPARARAIARHNLNQRQNEIVGQAKETMARLNHGELMAKVKDKSLSKEERMAASGVIASRDYRDGKIELLEHLGNEAAYNDDQEAMIEMQMQAMQDSGGNLSDMMGSTELGQLREGKFVVSGTDADRGGLTIRQHLMKNRLAAGKISTQKLATMDPDDMKTITELYESGSLDGKARANVEKSIADLRRPENSTINAQAKGAAKQLFAKIMPSVPTSQTQQTVASNPSTQRDPSTVTLRGGESTTDSGLIIPRDSK